MHSTLEPLNLSEPANLNSKFKPEVARLYCKYIF